MKCWRKPKLKYLLFIPAYFICLIVVPTLLIGGATLMILTVGAFNFDCVTNALESLLNWLWDDLLA